MNLTGYTASMEVRDSAGALLLQLTTSNGRLSLGGSAGTITMSLTGAVTAALTPGAYVYDLFLVSGGGVPYKPMRGVFNVEPRVTQNV